MCRVINITLYKMYKLSSIQIVFHHIVQIQWRIYGGGAKGALAPPKRPNFIVDKNDFFFQK